MRAFGSVFVRLGSSLLCTPFNKAPRRDISYEVSFLICVLCDCVNKETELASHVPLKQCRKRLAYDQMSLPPPFADILDPYLHS